MTAVLTARPLTLRRAVLVGGLRQVAPALAANPAVAAVVGLALLALPVVAVLGGARLGPDLAASLGDPVVGSGVTGALGSAVLVVCGAIAAAAPTLRQLDDQLLCSPVPRRSLFLALVAVPVLGPALALAGLLTCALVPFSASAPSPAAAVAGLLALALSCAATGAALALAAAAAVRGELRGLGALSLLAALWLAVGVPGTTPVLAGQLGLAAQVVAGQSAWGAGAGVLLACGALAGAVWTALGARTAAPPRRTARASVHALLRGPVSAQFTATLVVLLRRRGTRNNVAAVVVACPVAALLLGRLSGVAALGLFLAGLTAVLGCLVLPLAAGGVDDTGGWFWRCVPRRRAVTHLVRLGAGLAGQLLVLAVCVLPWRCCSACPARRCGSWPASRRSPAGSLSWPGTSCRGATTARSTSSPRTPSSPAWRPSSTGR